MLELIGRHHKELTWEMVLAVPILAWLGLLIIEFTFKSRSSSADFWDCYI